jgi:spore coat polysaccharide biosynthesis protein SpsF
MSNTLAIVQARMSSARLPGKVLADIEGATMLERVLQRAQSASRLDGVVVATSSDPADDPVEAECRRVGVPCFRGSHDDVLDRFYRAARAHRAEVVVRLTADCPLIDPAVIDLVVQQFDPDRHDYVSNTIERRFPDGLDTEVLSLAALEAAWTEARLTSEREHVTPFIWKQPERFRQHQVLHDRDLSVLRWTVDEPRDLDLVRRVYRAFVRPVFGMEDILGLLAAEPSGS